MLLLCLVQTLFDKSLILLYTLCSDDTRVRKHDVSEVDECHGTWGNLGKSMAF